MTLRKIPRLNGVTGVLRSAAGAPICAVGPRTGWYDWLESGEAKSFRFIGAAGATCTVRRENRRQRSGETYRYWYAYRHVFGELKREYLGRSANLSIQVLESAAMRLAQLEMDVGDATMPGEMA